MPADAAAASWQSQFGATVRALRMSMGLSQMALGNQAGLHPTYISSLERGERNVSLVNIHRIAEALDVSPATLFESNR